MARGGKRNRGSGIGRRFALEWCGGRVGGPRYRGPPAAVKEREIHMGRAELQPASRRNKRAAPHTPAARVARERPASTPESCQLLGNQYVQRLLATGAIQAKLSISRPDDPLERQADRLADRVMRMPTPVADDPQACGCGSGASSPCPACAARNRGVVYRQTDGGSGRQPDPLPDRLAPALGAGRSLDSVTRAYFEPRFGRDFSQVRVHTGAGAQHAAREIDALAFTAGSHIAFGADRYNPASDDGRRLLAHELAHVAQGPPAETLYRAETEDRNAVCAGLTDIRSDVNTFVNGEISAARSGVGVSPVGPFLSDVADRTGGSGAVSPIETFVEGLGPSKRFLPAASLSGTRFARLPAATGLGIPGIGGFNIYDLHAQGLVHVVGSTAKINDICAGADKLGHFFQQGLQYFAIRSSSSLAAAESFGRATEIDRAGLGATGVYSNADLAANRDGLDFWEDLHADPAGLSFDIAGYISQDWNEYANPSFYESSIARNVWATQLTGRWTGSFGLGPALQDIEVNLTATTAGAVSGTFSHPSLPPALAPVTGTISGTITYNTTAVSGSIPSAVLHGGAGAHAATPVSGITINFTWTAGADSGAGVWQSVGEHRLDGTFGFGSSTTDRGLFNIVRA